MKEENVNRSFVYGLSLIATLGGFLFGYDTAVISGAVGSLECFFVTPFQLSETASHILLGLIISGALIGCVVGSALGGYCSQKIGRKRSLILAAFLFICSGIGSAVPEIGFAYPGTGNYSFLPQFIIYRIIGGIGVGLASVLSPIYIAEISPSSIRGRLVSWNQMAIVTGILVVYFVNYYISGSGDADWNEQIGWRWMFASSAIPALLFFICLFFVPESPRWLLQEGRVVEAQKIMSKLNIQIETTHKEIESRQYKVGNGALYVRALIVGIVLSAFQQLVGIQVMLYYAPEIFKNMGLATDSAMWQTILVGVTNLIFTIVAIYTVDRYGRKPLLLSGSGLMALFMGALSVCFYSHHLNIIALICVLGFVASFAFSWGPVTWVLLSEMFPNAIRSKAMSIAVAIQWITNYTVSSIFPMLDKSSYLIEHFNHAFSFGLFSLMAALSGLFVWKMIPETKGKSLEQMENIWKKQS